MRRVNRWLRKSTYVIFRKDWKIKTRYPNRRHVCFVLLPQPPSRTRRRLFASSYRPRRARLDAGIQGW